MIFQVNRDPIAAQMQKMRGQIEQLQAELLYYRGDSSVSFEELQVLHLIEVLLCILGVNNNNCYFVDFEAQNIIT